MVTFVDWEEHPNAKQMLPLVMRGDNASAERFHGMGFRWNWVRLCRTIIGEHYVEIRGKFTCICNRTEMLSQVEEVETVLRGYVNIYQLLDKYQAMSREHLLNDGYTVAEIDAMEARLKGRTDNA